MLKQDESNQNNAMHVLVTPINLTTAHTQHNYTRANAAKHGPFYTLHNTTMKIFKTQIPILLLSIKKYIKKKKPTRNN
jgi:heme/copper-type cytochrome/quinol oxidase subunit 2